MSTDALELAMALHQAPIQRFALRDRPLPENMGLALQIASATQPQLENAAALFSEPEETVLEAVRFYLHQVLFEPGTDAYRVLGLSPAAESKQIRQHYILLQRWLHPDRRGEDWEAVFATKVNWAWQQLRNPKAREAYDGSRGPELPASAQQLPEVGAMPLPAWSAEPIRRTSRHWLRGITIGGLLVFCAGLFYLAVTRDDYLESDAQALHISEPVASPQATSMGVAAGGGATNAGDSIFTARADSGAMESGETRPSQGDRGEHPIDRADPAVGEPGPRTELLQATANDPVNSSTPAALTRPPRADRPVAVEPDPAQAGRVAHASGDSSAIGQALAYPRSSRRGNQRREGSTMLAHSGSVSSANEEVAVVPASDSVDEATAPASLPEMATDADVTRDASASTDALPGPSSVAAAPGEDAVERFEMARERLRSMVSYLRSKTAELPQWSDMPGQLTAERERKALHARNGHVEIDRFALDPPTWRMSDAAVALEATYHVDADRKVAEKGRFYLDMAWRDGGWKITRMKMLPTP